MAIRPYKSLRTSPHQAASPGCLKLVVDYDARPPAGPSWRIYDDAGLCLAGRYSTITSARAWRRIQRQGERALRCLQKERAQASVKIPPQEVVIDHDRYADAVSA